MGQKRLKLNRCGTYMMLGLIIGSFVYGVLGCIALGIGLFLSADQLSFVPEVFLTSLLTVSSGLIVAAGALVFLFSFVGCLAVFLRNQHAVLAYFVGMCIVYLLASSGVAMSIVFRSWVTEQLRSHMNEILQDYYGVNLNETRNQIITESWDMAQEKWYCCGIDSNGWGVYRGSAWFREVPGIIEVDKTAVPESCCKKNQYGRYIDLKKCQTWVSGPPYRQSGKHINEALFYKGCYERGNDRLYGISIFLIIMGLVVALVAIVKVVLLLFYAKMLD